MVRWPWTVAMLGLLVCACAAAVGPPIDYPTVLLGTWQGDVQMAAGNYPRTLTIFAIDEIDGRAVADAEWGGPGGSDAGILPVLVAIEVFGKDVILRFTTMDASRVELTLYPDGQHLLGDLRMSVSSLGGSRAINPIRLTKEE